MRLAAGVWGKGHWTVRGRAACPQLSASVSSAAGWGCCHHLASTTHSWPKHVHARELAAGVGGQTASPRPRGRRPLAGGQRPRPGVRPGPTHVEAGLVHQQLGVHQVHVSRAGGVFQQADDDRGAQAVAGVLQGCAWDRKKPPEGRCLPSSTGTAGDPWLLAFGVTTPSWPGSDASLRGAESQPGEGVVGSKPGRLGPSKGRLSKTQPDSPAPHPCPGRPACLACCKGTPEKLLPPPPGIRALASLGERKRRGQLRQLQPRPLLCPSGAWAPGSVAMPWLGPRPTVSPR